jgi:carboxymethylenebutenolidase
MCDEDTLEDEEKAGLTRREFNTLAGGAVLAMALPPVANAMDVVETDVNVTTPDGEADCYFVHPASGNHPGVLLWPDIASLRPAFRTMAKRLAESGYAVLAVNPYYRSARSPVVQEGMSWRDESVRSKIFGMRRTLSAETTVTDAKAFVGWLDAQSAVDTSKKVGTMGYCMTGPFTMRTAAALPDRIGAGASFHGGGLVTEEESSPHLLVPQMKASFLFAIGSNDHERQPTMQDDLRQAYDAAGLSAEIEVYDALHGWCVLDSSAYKEAEAERAWGRLLALFESSL